MNNDKVYRAAGSVGRTRANDWRATETALTRQPLVVWRR